MSIVTARRDGRTERIAFVHWPEGPRAAESLRLRVDGVWHDVESKDQIVALLKHAGYDDIRAPEIIVLQ